MGPYKKAKLAAAASNVLKNIAVAMFLLTPLAVGFAYGDGIIGLGFSRGQTALVGAGWLAGAGLAALAGVACRAMAEKQKARSRAFYNHVVSGAWARNRARAR